MLKLMKWGSFMIEKFNSKKFFIDLLTSYINGSKIELKDTDSVNWKEVYYLANIHNMVGQLYVVLRNSGIHCDAEIMQNCFNKFTYIVQYSIKQEMITHSLMELLNKNKIKHIMCKGFVLRNFYPQKELSTMGDVYIVIQHVYKYRLHNILIENGYKYDEFNSHGQVWNYIKNGIVFEIHRKLVGKNIYDDVDMVGYFEDNFKFAEVVDRYTYEFKPEHHFIYLITHMTLHFRYSGFGVRMLLDIPIFIKRYGNNLDWNYVQDNLKKLKLYDFANNILTVCNKWFGIKLPYGFDVINKSDLKIFENYILDGGVFGYTNRNVDAINGANNSTTFIGGLKSILERVFPSYDKLKERYAWFGSPPKMLLPLGWVRFWLYRLKYGKIGDIKRIGKIVEVSDDVVIHNSLMEKLGLKEKRK